MVTVFPSLWLAQTGHLVILLLSFHFVLDIFTNLEDWSLQVVSLAFIFVWKDLPSPSSRCHQSLQRASLRALSKRWRRGPSFPSHISSQQAGSPTSTRLHQSPGIWELFLRNPCPSALCMLTRLVILYADPSVPSLCALHHDWHCFKAETVLVLTFIQQVGVVYCWAIRA